MMIPQEIIRAKRDGDALVADDIARFVRGLADGSIADAQVAAFAMAVFFQGMSREETVALTLAMRDSGAVMTWPDLDRPIGDKHSTGGVGDNVSLILAPVTAACGLAVPMISGRGLGHTGGTLDKLESIPGYQAYPDVATFRSVVREVGCAIVGQTGEIAPADKRLYAIRDVTATVDSVPLITGSILSKKLAAGLQSLTMDIKVGNGAFMTSLDEAEILARSIVEVANGAGTKTSAIITDMNQPLANCAGNAVEVAHAMEMLEGQHGETRSHAVVMALAADMLFNAGLFASVEDALEAAQNAIASGAALSVMGRMVAALGGPRDFAANWRDYLPVAPVISPVKAPQSGHISHYVTREIGMAVIGLGGGRMRSDDRIDHRTGFTSILPLGSQVEEGMPIAHVHAVDEEAAQAAIERFLKAATISDEAPVMTPPVVRRIS